MQRRPKIVSVVQTLIAILALLLAASTRTHADSKPLTDYVKVVWGKDEGLPQDSIKKVLQTKDGYVWVGTQEGLARFDGVHLPFSTHRTPHVSIAITSSTSSRTAKTTTKKKPTKACRD